MRPFAIVMVIALFSLPLSSCALYKGKVYEGRAIWVVRHHLRSPIALDQITQDAQEGGFNLLFMQVQGRGDSYYHSQIVPRSEVLIDTPPDYDPLDYILQKGHAAGLQIHAWLNTLYVWSYPPPYPLAEGHVVNSHPEWLIKDENGRNLAQYTQSERTRESSEGLYLDPSKPQVRDHLLKACKEVVENYDVDGLHLDFIRYPGDRWGYNNEAMEQFLQRWKVDPRLLSTWVRNPQPERFIQGTLPLHLRWHYYYYSLWNEARSGYITELVRGIQQEVKSIKPQVILSAAVFPDPEVAYCLKGQDWTTWLSQGYIDLVVPMAYHGDSTRVVAQMAEVKQRAQGRMAFAGLGAWIKDPAQIQQEVEGLQEIGINGFSYFSYQGMQDLDEEYIKQIKQLVHRRPATPPRLPGGPTRLNPFPALNEADGAELLLRSLKKQFFSLEDYHALLLRLGIDEAGLLERLQYEAATFERMTQELYHAALFSPDETVSLPPSVDLQAIFRYVHPKDSPQHREEASTIIHDAYQRLINGEDFARVARQCSQGVTAGLGGVQERIYLQDGWDLNGIISFYKEGEFTPVIELPKGYIIYKVLKFHPPEQRRYGDLPWRLKTVVFQERLAQMVGKEKP